MNELKLIKDEEKCLKPGATFEKPDKIAYAIIRAEHAICAQKEKEKMFKETLKNY